MMTTCATFGTSIGVFTRASDYVCLYFTKDIKSVWVEKENRALLCLPEEEA